MATTPRQYQYLGGVVPCPGGWVVVSGRLAGVTMVVEEAMVLPNLLEVLDHRPKFDAGAIYAPIGLADQPCSRFRPCDEEARQLLGWPRSVGIRPVPSRAALNAPSHAAARELEPWLTNDDLRRFPRYREVEDLFQPFHQRMWVSAHPDLSFYMLNGDRPLKSSPFHGEGIVERIELIRAKVPGIEDLLNASPPEGAGQIHIVQAAALLWTARRGAGRAINRLPMDPTWDSNGLRTELVR